MLESSPARWRHGFTLVELILVMALLATVMAFAAPVLSRSMRERHLNEEALRFLALTEFARDEAVSQGIPMVIWIDAQTQRFGLEAKSGYSAVESRPREYVMDPDIRLEVTPSDTSRSTAEAIELAPDGTVETTSAESIRLVDRFDAALTVARTSDGWGYEILEETP